MIELECEADVDHYLLYDNLRPGSLPAAVSALTGLSYQHLYWSYRLFVLFFQALYTG